MESSLPVCIVFWIPCCFILQPTKYIAKTGSPTEQIFLKESHGFINAVALPRRLKWIPHLPHSGRKLELMLWILHFTVPCTYREDCTFGEWGTWRGVVNAQQPGCYPQIRSKPYNHPLQTQYRRFSCGGLNIGCPAPPVQRRRQCKLKLPVFEIHHLFFTGKSGIVFLFYQHSWNKSLYFFKSRSG